MRTVRPRLEAVPGGLAVHTPYNAGFVAALKTQVSPAHRKWDGDAKVWLVAPTAGPQVQQMIATYFGAQVTLPAMTATAERAVRLLDVRYIGAGKVRDDGSESSLGWMGGGWNVVFPVSVLMQWFGDQQRPAEAQTLYAVLGVGQDADDAAIRAAWKRMGRQWHPDVCREPDAATQFVRIKEAYDVLKDAKTRARYNAGLAFEGLTKRAEAAKAVQAPLQGYRPPLRCGYILAAGESVLGRVIVREILQWADITDDAGRVLVTSWPAGADAFVEAWS